MTRKIKSIQKNGSSKQYHMKIMKIIGRLMLKSIHTLKFSRKEKSNLRKYNKLGDSFRIRCILKTGD